MCLGQMAKVREEKRVPQRRAERRMEVVAMSKEAEVRGCGCGSWRMSP